MPGLLTVKSRVSFQLSNWLFTASLLCLCLTEAFLIRSLWVRPEFAHRRLDLPLLAWVPAFGEMLLLRLIRKHMREGQLSPKLAVNLSSGISILLLLAYLLITRFAQVCFR